MSGPFEDQVRAVLTWAHDSLHVSGAALLDADASYPNGVGVSRGRGDPGQGNP